MRNPVSAATTTVAAILMSACVTVTPVPGADKVHLTQTAADVTGCTAVGNIKATRDGNGGIDPPTAETELRNQTVGLSGNTAFISSGSLSVPMAGVAYRCP
jgi:hypothetical protein